MQNYSRKPSEEEAIVENARKIHKIDDIDHVFEVTSECYVRSKKTNMSFKAKYHTISSLLWRILIEPQTIYLIMALCILIYAYIQNTNEKEDFIVFLSTILLVTFRITLIVHEIRTVYFYYKEKVEFSACKIIKDERVYQMDRIFLKIGDICEFSKGDIVGADCIILASKNLIVDTKELTKSDEYITKQTDDYLYAGEKIISGLARGVVIKIGLDTELGKLGQSIDNFNSFRSDIYFEMITFIYGCLFFGLLLCLILVPAVAIYRIKFVKVLLLAMSILISLFPEGIPSAVLLLQFAALKNLENKNVYLRDFAIVEKFGSATVLISSKSTLLHSSVKICENIFDGTNIIDLVMAGIDKDEQTLTILKFIGKYAIILDKNLEKIDCYYRSGLLVLAKFCEQFVQTDQIKVSSVKNIYYQGLDGIFFKENNNEETVFIGEVNDVLIKCDEYILNNIFVSLSNLKILEIMAHTQNMILEGYKPVSIALRYFEPLSGKYKNVFLCNFFLIEELETELNILQNLLHSCEIQFCLLTDTKSKKHLNTCRKIVGFPELLIDSKKILLNSDERHKILKISDYKNMNIEEKNEVLKNEKFIIFECDSNDKLEIFQDLEKMNNINLFLSKNIKDIKLFGKSYLSVTFEDSYQIIKEASSAIIKPHSLESIMFAIQEGRMFFANLTKALRFVCLKIIPQLTSFIVFALFTSPLAFSPILTLVLNYFIILIPVKSFAYEKPECNLLTEPSVLKSNVIPLEENNDSPIDDVNTLFSRFKIFLSRLKKIVFYNSIFPFNKILYLTIQDGIISGIGCILTFYLSLHRSGVKFDNMFFAAKDFFRHSAKPLPLRNGKTASALEQLGILYRAQSTFFMSLVIFMFFSAFICRRKKQYVTENFFTNFWFFATNFISLGSSLVLVYVDAINKFLLTTSPDTFLLIIPVAGSMLLILIDTFKKYRIKNGLTRN